MSQLLFTTNITTQCHEYFDTSRMVSYRVILTVDSLQAMRKENANTLSFFAFKVPAGWKMVHTEQTAIFELTQAISLSRLQKIIEEKNL